MSGPSTADALPHVFMCGTGAAGTDHHEWVVVSYTSLRVDMFPPPHVRSPPMTWMRVPMAWAESAPRGARMSGRSIQSWACAVLAASASTTAVAEPRDNDERRTSDAMGDMIRWIEVMRSGGGARPQGSQRTTA